MPICSQCQTQLVMAGRAIPNNFEQYNATDYVTCDVCKTAKRGPMGSYNPIVGGMWGALPIHGLASPLGMGRPLLADREPLVELRRPFAPGVDLVTLARIRDRRDDSPIPVRVRSPPARVGDGGRKKKGVICNRCFDMFKAARNEWYSVDLYQIRDTLSCDVCRKNVRDAMGTDSQYCSVRYSPEQEDNTNWSTWRDKLRCKPKDCKLVR